MGVEGQTSKNADKWGVAYILGWVFFRRQHLAGAGPNQSEKKTGSSFDPTTSGVVFSRWGP